MAKDKYTDIAALKIEEQISQFDGRNMIEECNEMFYEKIFTEAVAAMPVPGFYWIGFADNCPIEFVPAEYGLTFYYGRPGWYSVGSEVPSSPVNVVVGPAISEPVDLRVGHCDADR